MHEQLWDKQLTEFKWLDNSGLVQQTTFSDGSTITANFGSKPSTHANTQIPAQSVLAQLSNGRQIKWQANPNQ